MMIKKDPIENSEQFTKVIKEIDDETEKLLTQEGVQKTRGYILKFWQLKKKLLKEKYNIDWKTPEEMNPGVLFD